MALPPLYKYLDIRGAKLTLSSGRFKHAKPSDFNDTEDLTVQSIFPEETETALKRIEHGLTDVILEHLNEAPTCASPMRERVRLLQAAYKANPQGADIVKSAIREGNLPPIYDLEHMRREASALIEWLNEFLQGYRVLCVSSHLHSERMWSEYAEGHRGVVLRVKANEKKDSKFSLFRPVDYREHRPALYDQTLDFIAGSLFGDQQAHRLAMLDRIIYSKTLQWQHESEYRLAIPLGQDEAPWDTLPFHSEELTELYLGSQTPPDSAAEIVSLALRLNPKIAVFQAMWNADGGFVSAPI
jgi:hypothetical protein